jgi:hypothetical protein
VTLPTVKPNEIGKFVFALDTKATKLYGPVEVNAYVMVDGKLDKSEAYMLTVKANIVEDFSQMTVEEKQQAPITEMQNEYTVGKIAAGKTHKYQFAIKNSGVNPLEIRRVYAADKALNVKQPKAIKSGKKGNVTVEINTKGLDAGAYTREVVVITNDYAKPIQKVQLHFTVE